MDSILENRNSELDFIENEILNETGSASSGEDADISGIEMSLSRGLTNLRSMVHQYKDQIHQLKAELEQAKSQNQGSDKALKLMRQTFDHQINEFIAYSFELEQKIGAMNRDIKNARQEAAVAQKNSDARFATINQELFHTKQSLSQSEAALTQAQSDFSSRLHEMAVLGLELEEEIRKLQGELTGAKSEIEQKEEALRSLRATSLQKEKFYQGEIAELQKNFQIRETEFIDQLAEKDQLLKEREVKLAEMEEDFANRLASMAGINYEIEAKTLRGDLTRLRKTSEVVEKDLKDRLENASKSLHETEFALRQKERDIQSLTLSLDQEKDKASELEKSLFELNAKIRTSTEAIKLKDSRIDKLQREITEYQARVEQKEMKLQSMSETVEFLNLEIQKMEMSKFETHRVPLLQKEIKARDEQIEILKKELVSVQTALEVVRTEKEVEKSASQQLVSQLQSEIHRLSIEVGVAQQLAKSGETRHAMEMKELREAQEKLKKRESQLQSYAMILSNEKEELAKNADSLAAELRNAHSLHPLRDYLDLTERELTRLEVQLKKTPVSAPDRAQLEGFVDQLMEQKKFLETVIEASEKSLAEQAVTVQTKAENKKAAAVPPLPPKVGLD